MLVIDSVDPDGVGARAGLRSGDRICAINGRPTGDYFDYQFDIGVSRVVLTVRRGARDMTVPVRKRPEAFLDVTFKPFRMKRCGNRCIFCFVDQLPRGLRPGLGIKDEDYRLSFLYGNYITGTNLTGEHVDRIIRLALSPLYVSVHVTDPDVRGMMLGRKGPAPVMPLLSRLAGAGITLHTQVVICPGINDGMVLDRTVRDLRSLYPAISSVALIPVGLTRHREGLYPLKTVSRTGARDIIDYVRARQREYKRDDGVGFVYAADELYLRARLPVPRSASYDGFPQIENGIGMLRDLEEGFRKHRGRLARIPVRGKITLVTGAAAGPVLKTLLAGEGLDRRIRVIRVQNRFLGPSVTVSGLLAGRDILSQLRGKRLGSMVVLPPNCLNEEGVFIDDLSPDDLFRELDVPVRQGDYGLVTSILTAFGMINH